MEGDVSFLVWGVVAYVIFGSILFGSGACLSSESKLPKPAEYGLKTVKAIRIETNSGRKLLAWWHKPQIPSSNHRLFSWQRGSADTVLKKEAYRCRVRHALVSYSYNAGAGGTPARNPFMTTAGAQSGLFRNRKFQARALV